MSAISSIGGGLSTYIRSLSAIPASSAASAPATATPNTSAAQVKPARGHHHHGGVETFSKIQDAVTSALQSAKTNGSTDPNQVVADALNKFFQQNGAPTAGAKPAGPPPGTDATGKPTDAASPAGDSARQAFFKTLQSFGIDAQQFHSDFLSAVKSAQAGQTESNSVFQSVPTGSVIDTFA